MRTKYSIPGYPTVIVLKASGEEIDRIVGFDGDKDKFLQKVKDYANNKNTLPVLLSQYAADSNNVTLNYDLVQKYLDRYESANTLPYAKKVLKLKSTEFGLYIFSIHNSADSRNIKSGFICDIFIN